MVSKYMKLGPYVNYFNERICVHIKFWECLKFQTNHETLRAIII